MEKGYSKQLSISKTIFLSLAYSLLAIGCGQYKESNLSSAVNAQGDSSSYLPASSLWVQKTLKIDPTALPIDDQHYTTAGPKKGYVYVCQPKMFQQVNGPGAREIGSWVNQAN